MSIEAELQSISAKLDAHEKRHDRERVDDTKKRESCSQKFEKLFDAVGLQSEADREHKTRINGLSRKECEQDDNLKTTNQRIDNLQTRMDRWFLGFILTAVAGYILNILGII